MSVEERLTRDLRQRYVIEQLAAEAGVSPTSLKKYFAQTFGKPISAYLRELRVEKAKRLLEESVLNIADIANEVGYENQGKFGDMFRSQVGVTPLEYRRIHRSNIMKKERGF